MAATTPGQNVPGPRATIKNEDLPPLFRSNDEWALNRQSEALRATMTQLSLLLVATVCATLADHFDSHALTALSALLYGLTVVTGVVISRRRAHAHWQAHRDAAETVKSLAWQYMVHGGPFHSAVRDADGLFNQQLEEHLRSLRRIGWQAPAPDADTAPAASTLWDPASRHEPDDPRHPQITRTMRAVRDKPFTVRRDIYLRDRLLEQLSWYGGRAVQARRSAAVWSALTALLTLLALTAAVARSAGIVTGWDLSGLLAASAAAGVAWLETRRHHPLAYAHTLVREALETQRATLAKTVGEDQWPQAVSEAEHLMLPQHTDWLARFGG